MLTPIELGWTAGFFEGEGSFAYLRSRSSTGGAIVVTASQVQREPLDRLKEYFGGHLYFKIKKTKGQDFYEWRCSGPTAVGLMFTVFSLMSPRRQEQIKIAVAKWKASKVAFKYRTHCKRGHPYDETNTRTYTNYNGNQARECRTCRREIFGPKSDERKRRLRLLKRGSA